MSLFTIDLLEPDQVSDLNRFLNSNPHHTVFHSYEWHQCIQKAYGHPYYYWTAWEDDRIIGIFPVTNVQHPLLGKKFIAIPYQFHSGPPLADQEEVRIQLIERALKHAIDTQANYFEIRTREALPYLNRLGFQQFNSHLMLTETNLQDLEVNKIRKGHRGEIRYALRRGVEFVESKSLEDLRRFRQLYLTESKRLGSPQAGWPFFKHLHQVAPRYYSLLLAVSSSRLIGGLLLLSKGNTVFARAGAYGSTEARSLKLNKGLFWRALSDAAKQGRTHFNFGITWDQDHGLLRWKEGWNGTSSPVYTYIYPIKSQPPPAGAYFSKYNLPKKIWRLLPLPIIDLLGHQVTRWVC